MKIYTIGFTKKSARAFFSKLKESGAKRLVDVRLNNVSQLAGFAKKDDLRYFLNIICQMEYLHTPTLAPTQDILDESCLLCSEELPDYCHRRLVAEYLRDRWGDLEIQHII